MMMSISNPAEDTERVNKATAFLLDHHWVDGAHHKQWVIFETLKILLGSDWERCVATWENEEGCEPCEIDRGIAP